MNSLQFAAAKLRPGKSGDESDATHRTSATSIWSKHLRVLKKNNMVRFFNYLERAVSICSKIRTNNRVERCNRVFRYLEKVRYKWRCRRTIVRHILLQFENWMKRKETRAEIAV
jgi:hypothetical protein